MVVYSSVKSCGDIPEGSAGRSLEGKESADKLSRYGSGQPGSAVLCFGSELMA
jgi:hypothetical protein